MKSLINWSEVSRLLCGSPKSMNENRIPKKHRKAIAELYKLTSEWVEKYKNVKIR